MYLLCCSDIIKTELVKKFGIDKFYNENITYLEMQIIPHYDQINILQSSIDYFDYIVLVSPSCIDLTKNIITAAKVPIFLVMGELSYVQLSKLTNNTILYPKNSPGVSGLLDEILINLDLKSKKILLIKGIGGDLKLEQALKNSAAIFNVLEIYSRRLVPIPEHDFKKILDMHVYKGIIISSSGQVDWLFDYAKSYDCINEFQSLAFLTWHKKIEDKLRSYGVESIKNIPNPLLHLLH